MKAVSSKNRLVWLLTLLFVCNFTVSSKNQNGSDSYQKLIKLTYSLEEFNIEHADSGISYISSSVNTCCYKQDPSLPALPFIPVNIIIPIDNVYLSFDYEYSISNELKQIKIGGNPKVVKTGSSLVCNTDLDYNQKLVLSTTDNVEYVGNDYLDGHQILKFLICPFIYEQNCLTLKFVDVFCLNLTLGQKSDIQYISKTRRTLSEEDLKAIVSNREDVEEIYEYDKSVTDDQLSSINSSDDVYPCDYLIVTDSTLVNSFMPLVNWKRLKGVKTEIVSVQSIYNVNSSESKQIQLKRYLKMMRETYGIKYVLLGGDPTIVPTQGCFGYIDGLSSEYMDFNIPTDLFYASFSGSMNWNDCQDLMIGGIDDDISLFPDLYISRALVSNTTEVQTFVNKVIGYERYPTLHGWKNNMLMGGAQLSYKRYIKGWKSDAQIMSSNIFTKYIKPYWNGYRGLLFDTHTNLILSNDSLNFTKDNLQDVLSRGYAFVDINTHGDTIGWNCEDDIYTHLYADSLSNSQYTLITTEACSTNAFDATTEICLSKALMNNANSGVYAYYGSSRYGWTNATFIFGDVGISGLYNAEFYKALFSDEIKDKNYAKIVALSKAKIAPMCDSQNEYRWLQFSLNPIGDPETQIYTETPKVMSMPDIKYSENNNWLQITSDVDSCKICICHIGPLGIVYSNSDDNVDSFGTYVDSEATICITKQNYIPFVIEIDPCDYINSENKYIKKKIEDNDTLNPVFYVGEQIDVFNLQGVKIYSGDKNNMPDFPLGIYLIKEGCSYYKILKK